MAMVNEYEAHSTGGLFLVRFEDNSPQWTARQQPGEALGYAAQMQADLEFMGIDVDGYSYQSEMERDVATVLNSMRFLRRQLYISPVGVSQACAPEVPTDPGNQYPFAPLLTREKVILDHMQDINLLIRGFDLLGEYSFYTFLCDLWEISIPRQIFLPRLQMSEGEAFNTPVDVSKSSARCKIADLRKSFTAWGLREILALAYLKDPAGPWLASNVKANPVLRGVA